MYIASIVALPIGLVIWHAFAQGLGPLIEALTDEEAQAAFRLTFEAATVVTAGNVILGIAAAYALVRLNFPGRRLFDGVVDLPLALPTSVIGLTWAAILGPGSPFGAMLEARGLTILYEPPAVYIACAAVTLPFVIRAVQPILMTIDRDEEEAAATLGAGPFRIFFAVVLPALRPGILAGAAATFARSLGEFGAVVFLAGTEPFRTEVASTLVYARVEAFDVTGAASAAVVVLGVSYALFAAARRIERATSRRVEA